MKRAFAIAFIGLLAASAFAQVVPSSAGTQELIRASREFFPSGQVFFLNNQHASAADTADAGTRDKPFLTLAYAESQCVTKRGDIIRVSSDHYELVTSLVTLDTEGLSVIGDEGPGGMAVFSFQTNVAAGVAVGAYGITLRHLSFWCNIDLQSNMVAVTADSNAIDIDDCHFGTNPGKQPVCVINLGVTSCLANYGFIRNCTMEFWQAGATYGVYIPDQAERFLITNNRFVGNFATALIHRADAGQIKDESIVDNFLVNLAAAPAINILETLGDPMIYGNTLYSGTGTGTGALVANCGYVGENYPRVKYEVGETDIDISTQDYTSYQTLLTIAPRAGHSLGACTVRFDVTKATTGWQAVANDNDTITFAAQVKVDGTNWRGVNVTAARVDDATTVAGQNDAVELNLGNVSAGAQVRIQVKVNAERAADVDLPYSLTYEGAPPTITVVTAS